MAMLVSLVIISMLITESDSQFIHRGCYRPEGELTNPQKRTFKEELNQTPRKKQVRFAAKDDVNLLKEVLARNPFEDSSQWVTIAETVATYGLKVDGRRARERTRLLLGYFEAEDAENLRKSGTEEEYGEKEQLLEEVLEIKKREDAKAAEVTGSKARAVLKAQKNGAMLRDAALNNLKRRAPAALGRQAHAAAHPLQPADDSGDEQENQAAETAGRVQQNAKKRLSATDKVVNYLAAKSNSEIEMRKEELNLRRQELTLQQERFAMERGVRLADIEERKTFLALLKDKI